MKKLNRFGVVGRQGEIAILGAVAAQTKPSGSGLFERLPFDGMSVEQAINLATWLIVVANVMHPDRLVTDVGNVALAKVAELVKEIEAE